MMLMNTTRLSVICFLLILATRLQPCDVLEESGHVDSFADNKHLRIECSLSKLRDRGRRQEEKGTVEALQQTVEAYSDSGEVDYFADNGYGKPLSTVHYAAGVYDNGSTYLAYQGPHEDPYVVAYDHATSSWTGPVRAGTSMLGHDPDLLVDAKRSKPAIDNHGRPAMVMDDLGYVHVAFGSHGGDPSMKNEMGPNEYGNYYKGEQRLARSTQPYDVLHWQRVTDSGLSWNGCYAQFIKVPSLDAGPSPIYHFSRHGAHVSTWTYQLSRDNARTFEPPVPILLTQERDDGLVKDSWYCHFRQRSSDLYMVQAVCTYHRHWVGKHRHTEEAYNGYYMELDTRTGTWHNVRGEELSMPLTKEVADEVIRVFDSESDLVNFPYKYVRPGSVAVDEFGWPHLLFKVAVTGDTDGKGIGKGQIKLFYCRWNGNEWTELIAVTGEALGWETMKENGDMIVESTNQAQVVVALSNSTHADISTWWTSDGGKSWEKGDSLYVTSKLSPGWTLGLSALIYQSYEGARIAAFGGDPGSELAYRRLYLIGDDGPIPRPAEDAHVCSGVRVSPNESQCIAINKLRPPLSIGHTLF